MPKPTYTIGDCVTFERYGRPVTGPITAFETQTDKWSNQAGERVPRATPVVFATVLTQRSAGTRGAGLISDYLRKMRPATRAEIVICNARSWKPGEDF